MNLIIVEYDPKSDYKMQPLIVELGNNFNNRLYNELKEFGVDINKTELDIMIKNDDLHLTLENKLNEDSKEKEYLVFFVE